MNALRISLGGAPSEKSTTIKTETTKPNDSKFYYMPNSVTSQKRFTRKNNSSIDKKVNKSTSFIN